MLPWLHVQVHMQPKLQPKLLNFHVGVWTFAWFVRPLLATILCAWEICSGSKNQDWFQEPRLVPRKTFVFNQQNIPPITRYYLRNNIQMSGLPKMSQTFFGSVLPSDDFIISCFHRKKVIYYRNHKQMVSQWWILWFFFVSRIFGTMLQPKSFICDILECLLIGVDSLMTS